MIKVRKNHTRKCWVCHISFLFVYFGHWKKKKSLSLSKKKNLLILVKLVSGVDDELAKIVHNDRFQMCKFPFGPHPILTQVFFFNLLCCHNSYYYQIIQKVAAMLLCGGAHHYCHQVIINWDFGIQYYLWANEWNVYCFRWCHHWKNVEG